jgi:glycosyltransferase involved in cell wall biosynthesis
VASVQFAPPKQHPPIAEGSIRILHVTFMRPRRPRPAAEQLAEWPLLRDSLAALAARGHDVLSLVAGHTDDEARAGSARVQFVADGPLSRALRRPARLLRAARDFAPDVVHVHSFLYPVPTWWLTRVVQAPVLLQDHAGRSPRDVVRRRVLRRVAERCAGALFTVTAQALAFVEAGALPHDLPVREVFEGSCTFSPGDRLAERRALQAEGDPCVLWVGRLDHGKDPLTAIDALAAFAQHRPDMRAYLCYGDGPLEAAVRGRVAAWPALAGRIHFLGHVAHSEIERRLRAADVFFLSTLREGCNLSTIEALACGTPVVTTNIPEQVALVGDAGLTFSPGDAAGAANALLELTGGNDAERRRRARARFEAALSYERIAERLEAVYAEFVA